ncbi:MAG: hypothetical protein JRI65_04210 [Deltaproteobacteria bacterium]|nr:hypothetical protein [Deltaproteobacteria bacterium]
MESIETENGAAGEEELTEEETTETTETEDTTTTTSDTDVTQSQTTITAESTDVTTTTPHYGYFSALLTNDCLSYFQDAFVSTSRQDFNSSLVTGYGVNASADYIEGHGGSSVYDNPYVGYIKLGTDNSGTLGTSHPITWNQIGSNSYQQWGSWTTAGNLINVGGVYYKINNKGYYIFGDYTPDANVSGISGTYSGNAWGTYWSLAGGTDMTGTFSCDVNGSSGTISNFTMSVSGGGKSASISGASGSFNSSSFDISGGTWELNDGVSPWTPTGKSCHGSLYGPNGEYIGGAWGMYYDSSNGAAGIFQGSK